MKKEAKQKIPLDSFKQHFYRQPALTEPFQYPEEYRKTADDDVDDDDDNEDNVLNPMVQHSEVYELKKKLSEEHKERKRRLRMEAQIIDVYRVEDEVEDNVETLEKYFNDFVLHLQTNSESQLNRSRRKSSSYHHGILQNDSSMIENDDTNL